jgi:hypothetical protein
MFRDAGLGFLVLALPVLTGCLQDTSDLSFAVRVLKM